MVLEMKREREDISIKLLRTELTGGYSVTWSQNIQEWRTEKVLGQTWTESGSGEAAERRHWLDQEVAEQRSNAIGCHRLTRQAKDMGVMRLRSALNAASVTDQSCQGFAVMKAFCSDLEALRGLGSHRFTMCSFICLVMLIYIWLVV
ncbi:hypothetical protein EYF80_006916 [Liparis tanakae]|uniref:Uncharacterized protein n=1 Tax=Liparis tanakae TaxID=230148 RepID=A0A4Z2IYA2_9TELE|nr:hypothetical protein EYF80_006916 [Liparis tanakae]